MRTMSPHTAALGCWGLAQASVPSHSLSELPGHGCHYKSGLGVGGGPRWPSTPEGARRQAAAVRPLSQGKGPLLLSGAHSARRRDCTRMDVEKGGQLLGVGGTLRDTLSSGSQSCAALGRLPGRQLGLYCCVMWGSR